jgi:acetyltransferase-like isoleucine patch superfamily enzyme
MSGIRRAGARARAHIRRLEERRYLRRASREVGWERFAAFGENSMIHPPALVIGHRHIRVGRDVVVHPGAFLSVVDEDSGQRYDPSLVIGDRVRIGFDMVIGCCGSVEIGDDVLTADRVYIGDTFHQYRDPSRPVAQQGLGDPRPVSIGRGAFLGINSAILPGVTIGEGAYVGANAVVTRDVPPHSLAVGNPARVVRRWDGGAWVDVRSEPPD